MFDVLKSDNSFGGSCKTSSNSSKTIFKTLELIEKFEGKTRRIINSLGYTLTLCIFV